MGEKCGGFGRMGKMYQVGELVVYGMHGVCRVVSEEERLVDKKRLNYLALEPLSNGNSRFLVPTLWRSFSPFFPKRNWKR